jgi:hypothetical protein
MSIIARLRQPTCLTAAGVFSAALLLYIITLAPSVVALFDDSLEFQLVAYQLGIAHPTGYPLYTLLGKLFTLIPVGDIAYRVNLMSAVFGALTVALLYLLILQVPFRKKPDQTEAISTGAAQPPSPAALGDAPMGLGNPGVTHFHNVSHPKFRPYPALSWPRQVGAVIGALLLAVGLVFWQQATVAEVYTLNAFFVTALLFLAIYRSPQAGSPGRVFGLAFLTGLALTHHRTILLLLPALALYLLLSYGSRLLNPRLILLSLLFGLLPLLLYFYLPLRGHIGSLDGSYENSWSGFWRQVSASGYGLFIFDNPFGQERDALFYWDILADQFYTTVPGFIGFVYLVRAGRLKIASLTAGAFLTYFVFNVFYNVADIEVFFIPVFLIWAIWSGLGAAFLLDTSARLKYPAWRMPVVALFLALFAWMIFQLFQTNHPIVSQSYTWDIHDYGLDILQQPLAPETKPAIVGILGEMTLIRYYQQTENRRPDIETIAADKEADRLAAVEKLLSAGKSVYLTRELPGAAGRWSLNAVGPLIQVNPEPLHTPPNMAIPVNQAIIPEITLLGYSPARVPHTGRGAAPLRLTLVWQANAPTPADLKVSVRLLNPAGETQAVVDAAPVHFAYPTTAWRAGEIIPDVYDLNLPADIPPGLYTPLLIWYDPAQNAAEVGRIELAPLFIE